PSRTTYRFATSYLLAHRSTKQKTSFSSTVSSTGDCEHEVTMSDGHRLLYYNLLKNLCDFVHPYSWPFTRLRLVISGSEVRALHGSFRFNICKPPSGGLPLICTFICTFPPLGCYGLRLRI